ncbi:hypothetical protein BBJ28_00006328 [Nothophytophthora sp. Chile5]|nr:hypothetical protein BBJ28_00006328 [Nothophytophthora sp. Chile5]
MQENDGIPIVPLPESYNYTGERLGWAQVHVAAKSNALSAVHKELHLRQDQQDQQQQQQTIEGCPQKQVEEAVVAPRNELQLLREDANNQLDKRTLQLAQQTEEKVRTVTILELNKRLRYAVGALERDAVARAEPRALELVTGYLKQQTNSATTQRQKLVAFEQNLETQLREAIVVTKKAAESATRVVVQEPQHDSSAPVTMGTKEALKTQKATKSEARVAAQTQQHQ